MAFLPSVFFQFVASLKSNIPIYERKLGLNSSVEIKGGKKKSCSLFAATFRPLNILQQHVVNTNWKHCLLFPRQAYNEFIKSGSSISVRTLLDKAARSSWIQLLIRVYSAFNFGPYILHMALIKLKKTKFCGLSPRVNYTDRATAACRRSDCELLRIQGATWSAWRIPTAVSRFSRQEPLLFYQVAPQLYSRGWVHPVPDTLLFFPGSAGNRTRASGSVAKNSDH
jgi:hypothetical protein